MIIQLPPQSDKHQLTAKAPIHHLADHKEFFLLFNNRSYWQSEEQYQYNYNLLSDRLLTLSTSKGCSLNSLKQDAKYLRREFKRVGADIKLHSIHTALSGALGYSSYILARDCRAVDDFIDNLWPTDVVLGKKFMEGRLCLEEWPSTKLFQSLKSRISFNKKRDRIAKLNAEDLKVITRKRYAMSYEESRLGRKQDPADSTVDGHGFLLSQISYSGGLVECLYLITQS
ncbi:hypothetical protein [Pseudomonas sp. A-B-19]|uniref:hypothetical protein n=1 Tax=Pseudomonas sp. A-B-19 TaxID=2832405 RepID=UPI001CBD934C|nr:hypothetical protein [Pseudomonas sp. A-B-19]